MTIALTEWPFDLSVVVTAGVLFLLAHFFRLARYWVCLGRFSLPLGKLVNLHLFGSFLSYMGLPFLTYEAVMIIGFAASKPRSLFAVLYSLILLRIADVIFILALLCLLNTDNRLLMGSLIVALLLGLMALKLLPAMLFRLELLMIRAPFRSARQGKTQVGLIRLCVGCLADLKLLSWDKKGTTGTVILFTTFSWGLELLALTVLSGSFTMATSAIENRMSSALLSLTNAFDVAQITEIYTPLIWTVGVALFTSLALLGLNLWFGGSHGGTRR